MLQLKLQFPDGTSRNQSEEMQHFRGNPRRYWGLDGFESRSRHAETLGFWANAAIKLQFFVIDEKIP